MKKRTTLLARIALLEWRRQPNTALGCRVVFTICTEPDENIASFNDNNDRHCHRLASEPLQPFIDRAFAVTGAHAIYASYEAATAAPERDCEAERDCAPSQP